MTSASSSSGAMTNMSRMLASSRLSSHHPKVGQVYTAPPSHISRGDFGTKRPLPTSHLSPGTIRYVEIGEQDTKERQTIWREREREVILLKRFLELNVRLGERLENESSYFSNEPRKRDVSLGSLGPRISTTYDPSTRRAVPTNYDAIPNEEIRSYLQSEAQLGRGPVYLDTLRGKSDGGPYGRASVGYTDTAISRTNYRTMSENQFAKFLQGIRANREVFREHLRGRAALNARSKVVLQYEKKRQEIEREANIALSTGATKVEVPEPVLEKDLPLPSSKEDGIKIDLWNELRTGTDPYKSLWEPWLQGQHSINLRSPSSIDLPPQSQPRGGEEIPVSQHVHGGLQYSQPDSISTQLLANSLPARILGKAYSPPRASSGRSSKGLDGQSVALGGRIALLPYSLSDNERPIDTSLNDRSSGNIRVKVVSAYREVKKETESDLTFKRFINSKDDRLPAMYGNTPLKIRASAAADANRIGQGLPGSQEWISKLDGSRNLQSGQANYGVINYTDAEAMKTPSYGRNADFNDDNNNKLYSQRARDRKARQARSYMPSSANKKGHNLFKLSLQRPESAQENADSNRRSGRSRSTTPKEQS